LRGKKEEKEHGRSVLQGEGKVTAVGAFDGGFEITSTWTFEKSTFI
jgi:hypothetical protein